MEHNLIGKKWYEVIDFYKLTGLVLIWISAWIFMIPHEVDVNTPFFDNVWGAFFSVFGVYKNESSNSQQLPDLMSGLAALFVMIVLQLRGIFSVTGSSFSQSENKKTHRAMITILDIFSILIHTLFFTMVIKIFLFPETGNVVTIYDKMKENIGITIFTAVAVSGMVFGVPSLAKLFLVLLFGVGVFKNLSMVSRMMGLSGFIAIVFSVIGFYLEFCAGSFDKNRLLVDLNILSGHYDNLYKNALSDGKKVSNVVQVLSGNPAAVLKSVSAKKEPKKSLLHKAEQISEEIKAEGENTGNLNNQAEKE